MKCWMFVYINVRLNPLKLWGVELELGCLRIVTIKKLEFECSAKKDMGSLFCHEALGLYINFYLALNLTYKQRLSLSVSSIAIGIRP